MPRLILASTSPYRRELLTRLRLEFETCAPEVTENHVVGESPAGRALRLAREKASSVARRLTDAVVIGSDQVAALDDTVLDKPGSATRCHEQLASVSGRTVRFLTACVVLGGEGAAQLAHVDTTTVVFRTLERTEIERYVAVDQPLDCAGSFKAEALGITLIERIESGDPTALIGLPLIWLAAALRATGFPLP